LHIKLWATQSASWHLGQQYLTCELDRHGLSLFITYTNFSTLFANSTNGKKRQSYQRLKHSNCDSEKERNKFYSSESALYASQRKILVRKSKSPQHGMHNSNNTIKTVFSWIHDAHQTTAATREDTSTRPLQVCEAVGAPFRHVLPLRDKVDRILCDYLVPFQDATKQPIKG
jgi:hypothetical protein